MVSSIKVDRCKGTWKRKFKPHGARLVHLIIAAIKRIRTSRLSSKTSLFLKMELGRTDRGVRVLGGGCAGVPGQWVLEMPTLAPEACMSTFHRDLGTVLL